ncbi:Asp-tRNA(Asn)/Glu-tRNA(Gln) amidotransferase subunit GatC [Sulfobacillus sp. hq2]|uniref:Asp-tRNA(Asn)/Glu-tRNA(Gln) amidotransferase subunit GatC n=1 Tax=Sulfobacillus sp. hq2 TaxID=2039167 RepID=UPI001FA9169B|nr:Asp-tRNA(Asn)/Glu-tRNA(Gln) amidotransferase subunit GatC [Sulfobacillus sp. hq2]
MENRNGALISSSFLLSFQAWYTLEVMEGYAVALSEIQVKHVARLARLRVESDEIAQITQDLDRVLEYVAQLSQLDTDTVEPTMHVMGLAMPLRADEVKPSLPVDAALKNAPDPRDHMFGVPRIMDGGDA